eukprot:ANDGO_02795.mRNA.1 hypothetical protein
MMMTCGGQRSLVYALLISSAVLLILGSPPANAGANDDHSYVTCGSMMKLEHMATRYRLHSHEVKYGSGSGQQSVTCYAGSSDPNSYWKVWGPECKPGQALKNGQVVTLEHVQTRKLLHSHLHASPLSGNQEVSAYEGRDSGDFWKIVTVDGSKSWKRSGAVMFEHVDTALMLASNGRHRFGDPIRGQQEVYAAKDRSQNVQWSAQEGLYIALSSEL